MRFGRSGAQPSIITLADRARDQRKWELAAGLYRDALRRNPDNPPIWVQYGHALKESGQLLPAEAAYRRALEGAPGASETHVQLGHVLKLQNRREEARAAYLHALVLAPDCNDAHQELAGLGWRKDELADVEKAVRTAVAPPARRRGRASTITLADRARDVGQWELAERFYRKALAHNPRRADIWVQYGHMLKEGGKLAEAAAAYRQALAYDRGAADPCLHLGRVLKLQGRRKEAEAAYLRSFVCDAAQTERVHELADLGWPSHEILELQNGLKPTQDPRNADSHLQLGHALKLQGESEEAKAEYLRAVTLDPSLNGTSPEFRQLVWSDAHFSEVRQMVGAEDSEPLTPYADPNPLKLHLDRPEIVDGSAKRTIRSGLLIEGWALARSGVASIDITVNGEYLACAHHGLRRSDVAEAHPGWLNADRSGFMLSIPGSFLPIGRHTVALTLRDNSGNIKEVAFSIDVGENSAEDGLRRKISQGEIDLQCRHLSRLNWHPKFCWLLLVGRRRDEISQIRATLTSLREQAYADWHVFVAPYGRDGKPDLLWDDLQSGFELPDTWCDNVLDGFGNICERVEFLQRGEAQSLTGLIGRFGGPLLFGVLAAGDELSRDALLEFAVISAVHGDADFFYSDELRISPVSKVLEPFLKPEWSPDLLLSTNYIGRLWSATAELVERTGATLDDVLQIGEYELVLRATEAANAIRRIPELLCRRGDERLDTETLERRALERAMARRGIEGAILPGSVSGYYRLKRTVITPRLVSIIIPTRASRGLIRTCIGTLRNITAYRNFEIICIDNIPDDQRDWKRWLRANSDKVIEMAEPFNWSRYNNRAVEAAAGEFLLFLNDDTEIIEPDWLEALVEHGQRPEVGVVGPMLLWPDRTVQSAGVFLTNDIGSERHAFRNAAEGDPGYFGLTLTQRNVIAINGACFFTRRDVFEQLGGFNEAHSVVNNETDYCLRVWRSRLLLVFTPYAKIIHHERASRGNQGEDYDARDFEEQWGGLFSDGDPYHHPRLSKDRDCFTPELEPVRKVYASHPLLQREAVQKILVLKLDHIGDCVTALPALRRLKDAFPHASLRILAGRWARSIWSLADGVDEVIEFDFFDARSERGQRELTELDLRSLRERLLPYHFDLAVDLRRHPETRHVLQYTGAKYLAGFDVQGNFSWLDIALEMEPDPGRLPKRTHIGESLMNLVRAIDASCETTPKIFRPRPSPVPLLPEPIEQRLFSRPVVCLHPAAGGPLKQWPPGYFARLIDLLVEREQVNVALIGGSDEKGIATEVLRAVRHHGAVTDLVAELRLADLPNLMLRCALFVGNDSGPKHLAAGLGVPTVAVHSGVVDPHEWGPVGPYAVSLRREMECSPCYLTNLVDCHRRNECMTGIMPGEVYTACKRMLTLRHCSLSSEAAGVSHSLVGVTNHNAARVGDEPSSSSVDAAKSGMATIEPCFASGNGSDAKTGAWVPVTDADIRCLKKPSFKNEVALFVTHSSDGRLKPHVYHYTDSLRRHGIAVILIVATDIPCLDADNDLVDATDGIFVRANEGFDFAAWAHVLHLNPELFSASILYLINDSLIGPTNDELFGNVLHRLRKSPADLIGLTENYEKGWHVQSYFFALRSHALSSAVFQQFIQGIVSYKRKEDVIDEYEIRLARILKAAGFECEVIFRAIDFKNLTTHHWKYLFRSGFPFIKTAVTMGIVEGVDTNDWREVLAEADVDISFAQRALGRPAPTDVFRLCQTLEEQNIETRCEPKLLNVLLTRVEDTFERYGQTEPYWSVITTERFLKEKIDKHMDEFFSTGRDAVAFFAAALRRNAIDLDSIHSVLELGCGVGRVTVHLADLFDQVIGVDISRAHLEIARRTAERMGKANIRYEHMSSFSMIDALPACDALYTIIVLQHNPPPVMRLMLERLLRRVNPGGVAYFQVPVFTPGYSYSVTQHLSQEANGIEQHVLPQHEVFSLLSTNDFDILEALPDCWLELPHISCSFVARRRSQLSRIRSDAG
jgi:ADP-heptose:LPS heptosyltransferase/GT2 family glycosyltransferase/tetratricopeptide (TPR) repeat protein/SAM-dependent methyltransferase